MIELNFLKGTIRQEFLGDYELLLTIPKDQKNVIEPLYDLLTDDKVKVCKIDHYKKKRSLNANSYAWVLMTEIAQVLRTSADEVYEEMLRRYGTNATDKKGDLITMSIPAGADISGLGIHCAYIGKGIAGGKEFDHYRLIKGSSQYNTKEMAILIDGIVSEATELKIPTMTPTEIEKLKSSWQFNS